MTPSSSPVPTARRLAGGTGVSLASGKELKVKARALQLRRLRMASAVGDGQESSRAERVKYKGLLLPRTTFPEPLVRQPPCLCGSSAEKRLMLMHAKACDSERRIPKGRFPTRPRFFLGVGGESCLSLCFGRWGLGWLPWQHSMEHPPPQHPAPEDLRVKGGIID